ISTAITSGAAETISLTATGAPSGTSTSLNPSAVTTGTSSTLTFSVDATTTPGTYPITVTGTSPSATHSTTVSLTVTPAPTSGITSTADGRHQRWLRERPDRLDDLRERRDLDRVAQRRGFGEGREHRPVQRRQLGRADLHRLGERDESHVLVPRRLHRQRDVRLGDGDAPRQHRGNDDDRAREDLLEHGHVGEQDGGGGGRSFVHAHPRRPRRQLPGRPDLHALRRRDPAVGEMAAAGLAAALRPSSARTP